VTEPTSEQIRTALERATVDAPAPHPWAEIERRAGSAGDPASSRLRPGIWLAAAACVVALIVGLVILPRFGDDEIRQDDLPSIVPATTTAPTMPPTSTVDASTTVTPESTIDPAEAPGSDQPPALSRPVSGETQRSVVGNITWTLLEGDASSVPRGPFIGVDGGYLGGVHAGRTWRSSDGLEWELVDLGDDGVADEFVDGEFEFRGETWVHTNDGLARWNGQTFVPVALPESPFVDLDGLSYFGRIVGTPVVLGDELVIPVSSELGVPWRELFTDDAQAEWEGDAQSIRIVDWTTREVLAVLSAEFLEGEPGRFEFRDVESNELVTTVEAVPGVDPAVLLPRIINGDHREILIGDADGFEAVEPPGGWGVPGGVGGGLVPFDGGVLGIGNQTPVFGSPTPFGPDGWEVWTSSDARSWTRLDLPTPSGSTVDIVEMASDGSTAILTIYSGLNESWITDDGSRWEEIDIGDGTTFSDVGPAEFGWLAGDDHIDIAISSDGRTWQEVRFGFSEDSGGRPSVVGRTIFVNNWLEDSTTALWVGVVDDR